MKRRCDVDGEYADHDWWRNLTYPPGLCCLNHFGGTGTRPQRWAALVAARKAAAPRGWTLWSVRQLTADKQERRP
ncbi:hypothetical protein MDOR_02720 [Mycolicibacterium doricum]|uniref:Uncharacterized protein n=1 Tax=Mycolicibacterium doricum TaxID=126673 RepID=A0A7I7VPM8_9MYCO|nr:hypothetical protein [Mycolicibacterium doricum]MCV7267860.1 hypothetical protein [Mycolicibacterium doricum]BBZ06103.1 hypothetical protein MDOR_02720 [Mycolicibacterium doricum]